MGKIFQNFLEIFLRIWWTLGFVSIDKKRKTHVEIRKIFVLGSLVIEHYPA